MVSKVQLVYKANFRLIKLTFRVVSKVRLVSKANIRLVCKANFRLASKNNFRLVCKANLRLVKLTFGWLAAKLTFGWLVKLTLNWLQSETERGPERLCRINKHGSKSAPKRRHMNTTTKTYGNSHLACE